MSTNLRKAQKHMQRAKELLNQSQLGFGGPSIISENPTKPMIYMFYESYEKPADLAKDSIFSKLLKIFPGLRKNAFEIFFVRLKRKRSTPEDPNEIKELYSELLKYFPNLSRDRFEYSRQRLKQKNVRKNSNRPDKPIELEELHSELLKIFPSSKPFEKNLKRKRSEELSEPQNPVVKFEVKIELCEAHNLTADFVEKEVEKIVKDAFGDKISIEIIFLESFSHI